MAHHLAALASPRGLAGGVSGVVALAGIVLAFADSEHRMLGVAVLAVGLGFLVLVLVWTKLSVAAFRTAVAAGAVPVDPQTRAYETARARQLRAALLQTKSELRANRALLASAIKAGEYWDSDRLRMSDGQWSQSRAFIGSEFPDVFDRLEAAYAESSRVQGVERHARGARIKAFGHGAPTAAADGLDASRAVIDDGLAAIEKGIARLAGRA